MIPFHTWLQDALRTIPLKDRSDPYALCYSFDEVLRIVSAYKDAEAAWQVTERARRGLPESHCLYCERWDKYD